MFPSLQTIRNRNLTRRDRHIVYYALGIASVILLYTVLYNVGMGTFENRPQSIFHSFQTVVETMTTTGYGADSPWESPVMNLFIVFMQITGIGIGFFTLRLVIIPLFTGAEVNLDNRLTSKNDHVIICEYRRDSAVLLEDLEELGIDYVLIESSRAEAEDLSNEGYAVIDGSPQDATSFERADIQDARAVITDAGDANVNTILTIRSLRPDIDLIALTDDSDLEDVLLTTGADTVLSPHGVLGNRLAERAVSSITADIASAVDLGSDIGVSEVPVPQGSRLTGVRLKDSAIREKTGANVIGAWIDGELQLPPDPESVIRPNTVLVVSGNHEALREFSEFARPRRTFTQPNKVVLAGYGDAGRAAEAVLDREGIESVTIDLEDRDGVDVVGGAAERDVLRTAGVEDAGAIIVGVPDDSAALLTTVLARSMNPDVEILVRVSDPEATTKALRAGADYVLSVPRISARMLARELRGEDVLAPASQIRMVRVPAAPFAGTTLAEAEIYERTGCRVIAVENEDGLSTTVDPGRPFDADDRLTIVGSDEAVQRFLGEFDVSPADTAP